MLSAFSCVWSDKSTDKISVVLCTEGGISVQEICVHE